MLFYLLIYSFSVSDWYLLVAVLVRVLVENKDTLWYCEGTSYSYGWGKSSNTGPEVPYY